MIRNNLLILCIVTLLMTLSGCGTEYFMISGKVTDWNGVGIVDVNLLVVTTMDQKTTKVTIMTDQAGDWKTKVPKGYGVVIPSKEGWIFTSNVEFDAISNLEGLDFVGAPEGPINFADPNFEAVIRNYIDEPTAEILTSDVDGLSEIWAAEKGIVDLGGIEHLLNLRQLALPVNNITDVSPLIKVKQKLGSLRIDYNSVKNPEVLSELNLWSLDISFNEITNFNFLSNIGGMKYLYLDGNYLKDITTITHMENLHTLFIRWNQVSDISEIAKLKNLSTFYATGNNITDLNPLKGMPELQVLVVNSNNITDISALLELPKLKQVDILLNPNLDTSVGSEARNIINQLIERGINVKY